MGVLHMVNKIVHVQDKQKWSKDTSLWDTRCYNGGPRKTRYGQFGVDLRDNPKKDEEKRRQTQMLPVLLVIYDAERNQKPF